MLGRLSIDIKKSVHIFLFFLIIEFIIIEMISFGSEIAFLFPNNYSVEALTASFIDPRRNWNRLEKLELFFKNCKMHHESLVKFGGNASLKLRFVVIDLHITFSEK